MKIAFSNFTSSFISTCFIVALELVVAVLIGFGFLALGADGGAWILGGIVAGATVFYVYRSRYNHSAKPKRNARKIGQILVGLTIGFSIQHSNLVSLSTQAPIFVLLTLLLLISGGAIGYLYSRLEKTDLLTAMLSTTPGNIGVMGSIAADYGKNASLVSLVQLMRFTAVTLIMPLIANRSVPTGFDSNQIATNLHWFTLNLLTFDSTYIVWLGSVLVLTTVVIHLGSQLNIPVATFLCSIATGIVFNSIFNLISWVPNVDFSLSPLFNLVGQILLGITIGEYWGTNPNPGKRAIARAAVPVTLTLLAGLVSAAIALLLTPWDWLTCLLVTAPGGSPEMIWIALAFNHDVETVAAGHLVRLIAINASLPALIALTNYLSRGFVGGEQPITADPQSPTPGP
ncbi:MAG: AbrB family transcriptional regulator [Leptolyngbyaceae cyanobacterium RU_5_1]|nr:AbrB family transcriptional regulator [Leptolyngbyaceae cyanobacterium RU_5_1]